MKKGILKTGQRVHHKLIFFSFFSDAMYNDSPFGYGLFPHDDQITVHTLTEQSKQFDAFNTKSVHVWIVIHKIDDTHIVKEAMTERNYQNLQQVYWYKPGHYVEGPIHRLTPACGDIITIGFLPRAEAITWNVSDNPRERHNFVSIPSVLTLAKDSAGNPINVTEKPPALAAHLCSMFCQKGATILVVGTGAGGCVKGMLQAGFNVVGVENDEKQFNQLFSEMNSWIARIEKEKEDAEKPVDKPKRAAKTTSDDADDGDVDEEQPQEPTHVEAAQQEGLCFYCDEPETEANPFDECIACQKQNHMHECMAEYPESAIFGEGFVCKGCDAGLFGGG